jgi:hypothetical protein
MWENQRCLGPQPPFQRLRPRLVEPASDPGSVGADAEITTVWPPASSDGRRHHLLDRSKRLAAQLVPPCPSAHQRGEVVDPPAPRAAEAPPALLRLTEHLAEGVGVVVVGQRTIVPPPSAGFRRAQGSTRDTRWSSSSALSARSRQRAALALGDLGCSPDPGPPGVVSAVAGSDRERGVAEPFAPRRGRRPV